MALLSADPRGMMELRGFGTWVPQRVEANTFYLVWNARTCPAFAVS